jgi:hypothetical protein
MRDFQLGLVQRVVLLVEFPSGHLQQFRQVDFLGALADFRGAASGLL